VVEGQRAKHVPTTMLPRLELRRCKCLARIGQVQKNAVFVEEGKLLYLEELGRH